MYSSIQWREKLANHIANLAHMGWIGWELKNKRTAREVIFLPLFFLHTQKYSIQGAFKIDKTQCELQENWQNGLLLNALTISTSQELFFNRAKRPRMPDSVQVFLPFVLLLRQGFTVRKVVRNFSSMI